MDKHRKKSSELLFHALLLCMGMNLVRSDAEFKCPSPKGMFPDPSSKNRFYECFDGEATLHTCGSGTVFRDGTCIKDTGNKSSENSTAQPSNISPVEEAQTTPANAASTNASSIDLTPSTMATHEGNQSKDLDSETTSTSEKMTSSISSESTAAVPTASSKSENDTNDSSKEVSPSTPANEQTELSEMTNEIASGLKTSATKSPSSSSTSTPTATEEDASPEKSAKVNGRSTTKFNRKTTKLLRTSTFSTKQPTTTSSKKTVTSSSKTVSEVTEETSADISSTKQPTKENTDKSSITVTKQPKRTTHSTKENSKKTSATTAAKSTTKPTQKTSPTTTTTTTTPLTSPSAEESEETVPKAETYKALVEVVDPPKHEPFKALIQSAFMAQEPRNIIQSEVYHAWFDNDEEKYQDDYNYQDSQYSNNDGENESHDSFSSSLLKYSDDNNNDDEGNGNYNPLHPEIVPSDDYNHGDWDTPVFFTCPEESGFFRHPIDCARFYWCIENKPTAMYCAPGTAFDPETHVCSWIVGEDGCGGMLPAATFRKKRNVEDDTRNGNNDGVGKETKDDIRKANRNYGTRYGHKGDGVRRDTHADHHADDGHFHGDKGEGHHRDNNKSKGHFHGDVPPIEPYTHRHHGRNEPFFRCPKESGFFRHPTNCSRFYWCNDFKPTALFCTPGTAFDPVNHVCAWEVRPDGCGGMLAPRMHIRRKRNVEEEENVENLNENGDEMEKKDDGREGDEDRAEDGTDRSQYDGSIKTAFGRFHDSIKSANIDENHHHQKEHHYHHHGEENDKQDNPDYDEIPPLDTYNHEHAQDDDYFRCPEESGFFRHPKNCSRFFWCIENKPTPLFCSPGTAFDPEAHVCAWVVGEDGCGGMLPPASLGHRRRRRRNADYGGYSEDNGGDDYGSYDGYDDVTDYNNYDNAGESDYGDETWKTDYNYDVTGGSDYNNYDVTGGSDYNYDVTEGNDKNYDVTQGSDYNTDVMDEHLHYKQGVVRGPAHSSLLRRDKRDVSLLDKLLAPFASLFGAKTAEKYEEASKNEDKSTEIVQTPGKFEESQRSADKVKALEKSEEIIKDLPRVRHPRQVVEDFFSEDIYNDNNNNNRGSWFKSENRREFREPKKRFQCPGDGFYADPDDCTYFYHCSVGKAYQHRCQPGTAFNQDKFVCSWPVGEDGCGGMLSVPYRENIEEKLGISTREPTPTFRCPEVDGYYADPYNCTVFYHCSLGKPYQHVCGGGTAFNEEQGVCAWPLTANGCGGMLSVPYKAEGDLKKKGDKSTSFDKSAPFILERAEPIDLSKVSQIVFGGATPVQRTDSPQNTKQSDGTVFEARSASGSQNTDLPDSEKTVPNDSEKSDSSPVKTTSAIPVSKNNDSKTGPKPKTDEKMRQKFRIATTPATTTTTTSLPESSTQTATSTHTTTSEPLNTRAAEGKSFKQIASAWPWDKLKIRRKGLLQKTQKPATTPRPETTTTPKPMTSTAPESSKSTTAGSAVVDFELSGAKTSKPTMMKTSSSSSVSTTSSPSSSSSSSSSTSPQPSTNETVSATNSSEENIPPLDQVKAEAYRVTDTGAEFECPSDDGHFRDPMNCAIYYHCAGGVAYRLDCPIGELYDIKEHKCLPVEQVKDCHLVDPELLEWEEQWLNSYPERPRPGEKERFQFECPEAYGYFRNPVDCASYVECMDSIPYPRKCMPGTMFDPERRKCTWGSLVPDCHAASGVHPPMETLEPADFLCPSSDGYYRDPFSCSAYYHCIDGRPLPRICDPNYFFDPQYSKCRWARLVQDCDPNGFPIFLEKLPLSSFVCPLPNGHFRDPKDCSVFYHCLRDYPYKGACRTHHAFDVNTLKCVPHDQVPGCSLPKMDQQQQLTQPTKDYGSLKTVDDTKQGNGSNASDDAFQCPKHHGLFRDPNDCRVFYHCFAGRRFRHECQFGTVFSTVRNLCTWPKLVPECPEVIKQQDMTSEESKTQVTQQRGDQPLNTKMPSVQDQGILTPERDFYNPFFNPSFPEDQPAAQANFQGEQQEFNAVAFSTPAQYNSFEFDLADPQRHVPEISTDGLNDFRLEAPLPEDSGNPMLTTQTYSNFVCPPLIFDQYFRDPLDCTIFHRCVKGTRFTFNCPRGTFFDPAYNICDFMENVLDCDHEGQRLGTARDPLAGFGLAQSPMGYFGPSGESMSEAAPEYLLEGRCPDNDGLFPHPTSCRKFLYCSRGVPTVLTCPGDLLYNTNTMTCDYDENIVCIRYDK